MEQKKFRAGQQLRVIDDQYGGCHAHGLFVGTVVTATEDSFVSEGLSGLQEEFVTVKHGGKCRTYFARRFEVFPKPMPDTTLYVSTKDGHAAPDLDDFEIGETVAIYHLERTGAVMRGERFVALNS